MGSKHACGSIAAQTIIYNSTNCKRPDNSLKSDPKKIKTQKTPINNMPHRMFTFIDVVRQVLLFRTCFGWIRPAGGNAANEALFLIQK